MRTFWVWAKILSLKCSLTVVQDLEILSDTYIHQSPGLPARGWEGTSPVKLRGNALVKCPAEHSHPQLLGFRPEYRPETLLEKSICHNSLFSASSLSSTSRLLKRGHLYSSSLFSSSRCYKRGSEVSTPLHTLFYSHSPPWRAPVQSRINLMSFFVSFTAANRSWKTAEKTDQFCIFWWTFMPTSFRCFWKPLS